MSLPQLIDSFGRPHRYLRISVTDRCNLRCSYCMPPEGIDWLNRSAILSYEEIVRLAQIFAAMGIRKIRLTGGEPLVRRDLPVLVEQLVGVPGIETVGLTTNGVYLADQAAMLKRAGLDALNVSLDTLRRDRFREIALRDELPAVLAGIDAALADGFARLKINMVVMGGVNDDELLEFVALARGRPLDVRFIEFMPFRDNGWSAPRLVPFARILGAIQQRYRLKARCQPGPPAVAKCYDIDGFEGSIGFITSMTADFCAGCDRIRLTAEGAVKPCLHDGLEADLRGPLRQGAGDGELADRILQILQRKQWGHAPMEQLVQLENRTMIQIGG